MAAALFVTYDDEGCGHHRPRDAGRRDDACWRATRAAGGSRCPMPAQPVCAAAGRHAGLCALRARRAQRGGADGAGPGRRHADRAECRAGAEWAVRAGETFWVEGGEGRRVQCWLMLPAGPGPHPLVLTIHGGPYAQYGPTLLHQAPGDGRRRLCGAVRQPGRLHRLWRGVHHRAARPLPRPGFRRPDGRRGRRGGAAGHRCRAACSSAGRAAAAC